MTTTGKLLDASTYPAGSAVTEAPVTDRLPVADPFDFSPDGGQVKIEGVVYSYSGVDFELSELIGAVSWPVLPIDALVLVEPSSETRYGTVALGDEGDALQALIPHALSALLPEGQRDPDNAETVTLVQPTPGLWEISDVLDRRATVTHEAGADMSDGVPPATSPALTAIGGIGSIHLRWVAITNPDFVTYQVHVSTAPSFTPDTTTLAAETPASSMSIKTLPDGSPLAYDVVYYFQLVATDDDGAAAPSAEVSATLFKVTGPDVAADYVYAGNIIADQILGGTINAGLLIAGTMKTAEAGARVEFGAFGFIVYDSAGTPTTLLGSNGVSTFKGQVEASTLTVTNGMSIRGTANEVAQAGSITLAAGVSASPNAPTVVNDWEIMPGWKDMGGVLWPTGYEYKSFQRVGSEWLLGMRQIATDEFVARQFNEAGTHTITHGYGWVAQQIQRCAYVSASYPVYAFRGTDRRLVAATHSTNAGPITNSIFWDFTSGQPAGTTPEGTVTYPSGRCRLSVTAAAGPASYLHNTANIDARGRRVAAQVWKVGTFNQIGQRIELRLRNATAGEYILARIDGDRSDIRLQTYSGPGTTKTAYGTRPPDGYYWRLLESNGDAKLQTSSNGTAWTTVATITDHGLTNTMLASMQLSLIVDDEDDGAATTGEFDNVSVGIGFVDFGDNIAWADGTNPPAMGSDGTNILVAERTSDSRIKIYEVDPRSPGRIVTTYTSGTSTDFGSFITPLVTVTKGSFDFGATRFIVTTGNSGDQFSAVFTVSGTTLTYQRNESFYVFGQGGSGWDGTVFQTLATDGVRRKHTSILWAAVPDWTRTFYAATTWYDGDATGGTHETTASPRAAFSLKKRSRYTVTSGDIPDLGGTDDPDRIRIYAADTSTATLWLQTTTAAGVNSAVLNTMTLSGTAAPVANDFPSAVAARIVNAGSTLVIDGGGSIKGTTVEATTELKSPLATVDRLIVTDRTFVQVIATVLSPVPATLTDVPGLTVTVDVDNTADIYLVMMTLDLDLTAGQTAPNGPFEARLMVNGVLQSGNANWRWLSGSATGQRATVSQQWLIAGQAAGNRVFKIQARDTTGGGTAFRVNATHSQMTIAQQQ